MTSDEAMEVLGYLLGHEKAVDSGEMEDVQNCLNSQEQEALKVVLSEFRLLKEKATGKKPLHQGFVYVCPCCNDKTTIGSIFLRINQKYCPECGTEFDWSKGKELWDDNTD